MKRNFLSLRANEIKEAIEENKDNPDVLKELIHEISFRKKASASLAPYKIKAENYIKNKEGTLKKITEKKELPKDNSSPIKNMFEEFWEERQENLPTKNPAQPKDNLDTSLTQNIEKNSDENDILEEIINKNTVSKKTQISIDYGETGIIRFPNENLKGVPKPYNKPLEDYFELKNFNKNDPIIKQFIAALSGLVWEIRNNSNLSKSVHLENGNREVNYSGEFGYTYSFPYPNEEDLFEGASIEFKSGTKKTKGTIVTILFGSPKHIVISLDEDFGKKISDGILTQDSASFYETLQKRLESEAGIPDSKGAPQVGMNFHIANNILNASFTKIENITKPKTKGYDPELNPKQAQFVHAMNEFDVSFLWGPPGTGKTQTLSAGLNHFYSLNERSLICSNTNQAVDQVLLKLCDLLTGKGGSKNPQNDEIKKQIDIGKKQLEDGRIIRLGKIDHPELEKKYSEYLNVDRVAERKSVSLKNRLDELENNKGKISAKNQKNEKILSDHNELISSVREQEERNKTINKLDLSVKQASDQINDIKYSIQSLHKELEEREKKGFLGRTFSRSEQSINLDLIRFKSSQEKIENNYKNHKEKRDEFINNTPDNSEKIASLSKKLENINLEEIRASYEKLNNQISTINREIKEIKTKLESLRDEVLKDAILIGSTITKCFISPNQLGKFQNIVIDEASMALLPALYFVASQAEKRCIISGDFLQLPPIVQTKHKTIRELIGEDIFTYAKISEDLLYGETRENCVTLNEQWRMNDKICKLISEIGYNGALITAAGRKEDIAGSKIPNLFKDNLTIIDTSTVYPFSNSDPYNSRSNILHAFIARNVIRSFRNKNKNCSIGYTSPFRAQIKLMKKIAEDEENFNEVSIGTVHTYQGDEKETIIFDTVDSFGDNFYVSPQIAKDTAKDSRLLTVAVSRAEARLIIIGNLKYLDSKLPPQSYLRHILYNAQSNGTVVDAKDVIDLAPLQDEIKKLGIILDEIDISKEELKKGLVNEDGFYPMVKRDISQAQNYIVFYSGFYTANRIKDLLDDIKNALNRGVKIRAVIPPPNSNGSMSEVEGETCIEVLQKNGVTIDLRSNIHQKAVLIDDDIAWFGSLNPLSYGERTQESMLRIQSKNVTPIFASNMAINRKLIGEDPSMIVEKENPSCSNCGFEITIYKKGRYGPYLECQSCKKTSNIQ